MPKTAWFVMLRRRAMFGFGVFDAATPAPMAGCITKNGATTVRRPMTNGGSSQLGDWPN